MSAQYDCIANSEHEQDAPDEDGFSAPKRIADTDSTAVIFVSVHASVAEYSAHQIADLLIT